MEYDQSMKSYDMSRIGASGLNFTEDRGGENVMDVDSEDDVETTDSDDENNDSDNEANGGDSETSVGGSESVGIDDESVSVGSEGVGVDDKSIGVDSEDVGIDDERVSDGYGVGRFVDISDLEGIIVGKTDDGICGNLFDSLDINNEFVNSTFVNNEFFVNSDFSGFVDEEKECDTSAVDGEFNDSRPDFVDDDKDADYVPSEDFEISSDEFDEVVSFKENLCNDRMFFVFESKLYELLKYCPSCGRGLDRSLIEDVRNEGSQVHLKFNCLNG